MATNYGLSANDASKFLQLLQNKGLEENAFTAVYLMDVRKLSAKDHRIEPMFPDARGRSCTEQGDSFHL